LGPRAGPTIRDQREEALSEDEGKAFDLGDFLRTYREPVGTVAAIRRDVFVSQASLEELRKAAGKAGTGVTFLAAGSQAEFIPHYRLVRLDSSARRALRDSRVKGWGPGVSPGVFLEATSCWWLSHAVGTGLFAISLAFAHQLVLTRLLSEYSMSVVFNYENELLDGLRDKQMHGHSVNWKVKLGEIDQTILGRVKYAAKVEGRPAVVSTAKGADADAGPAAPSAGKGGTRGKPTANPPARLNKEICFAEDARVGLSCTRANCLRRHLDTLDPGLVVLFDKAKKVYEANRLRGSGGKRKAPSQATGGESKRPRQ